MEGSVECNWVNQHHPQGMIVRVIMSDGGEGNPPVVILSEAKNQ